MDRTAAFRNAQAILNKFRRTGVTVVSMVRFLRYLLDIGAWRQLEQILIPDPYGEEWDDWSRQYVYKRFRRGVESDMRLGYSKKAAYGLRVSLAVDRQPTFQWRFDWS